MSNDGGASTSRKGSPRVNWSVDATWAPIRLWEDRLEDLRRAKRNGAVYAEIAEALNALGFQTTRDQVHTKIENLCSTYRRRSELRGTGPERAQTRKLCCELKEGEHHEHQLRCKHLCKQQHVRASEGASKKKAQHPNTALIRAANEEQKLLRLSFEAARTKEFELRERELVQKELVLQAQESALKQQERAAKAQEELTAAMIAFLNKALK
ncbi:hypothetical protein HPB47_014204 [Ixodes persulcatus]|uniref:Uncharacterized protein n=1 Tax=Ixodes persulcatus TaxID=34615 RepID=A0AC60R0T2_IXOPE|nr:hypothetical protein HPB47_014204 [Ixodes persulcatus]